MTKEEVIKQFVSDYRIERWEKDEDDEFTLKGCRGGSDGLFEPRTGVEDDDWPDFNDHIVESYFKDLGFNVTVYDHEKGWFTVQFD